MNIMSWSCGIPGKKGVRRRLQWVSFALILLLDLSRQYLTISCCMFQLVSLTDTLGKWRFPFVDWILRGLPHKGSSMCVKTSWVQRSWTSVCELRLTNPIWIYRQVPCRFFPSKHFPFRFSLPFHPRRRLEAQRHRKADSHWHPGPVEQPQWALTCPARGLWRLYVRPNDFASLPSSLVDFHWQLHPLYPLHLSHDKTTYKAKLIAQTKKYIPA